MHVRCTADMYLSSSLALVQDSQCLGTRSVLSKQTTQREFIPCLAIQVMAECWIAMSTLINICAGIARSTVFDALFIALELSMTVLAKYAKSERNHESSPAQPRDRDTSLDPIRKCPNSSNKTPSHHPSHHHHLPQRTPKRPSSSPTTSRPPTPVLSHKESNVTRLTSPNTVRLSDISFQKQGQASRERDESANGLQG